MANDYFNQIVQLNVSETVAPVPNRLQNKGAVVSIGGTSITPGETQYIASSTDLANYLNAATAISTIAWSSGVVTLVVGVPHGIPTGSTTTITVAGMVPTGYNGTYTATAFDTTTLNYALVTNPGASSTLGTVLYGSQIYLSAFDSTWWGQGNTQTGYYIFESGTADPTAIFPMVGDYLDANPQSIYNWGYLPGIDADEPTAKAFFLQYNALNSLIKNYVPVSVTTYTDWASDSTLRNTFAFIQSPGANVSSELDYVSFMQYLTAFIPTPTNKLPPSCYTFLNAVTAYTPLPQSLQNAFVAGNINFATTGAEGGISNTIIVPGKNLDGTPSNVAYSIDWTQINLNTDISNAVINGSNNPESPLYYDQNGINFLQNVAATTANRAISSGLALGRVILTSLDANTFATNVSTGKYAGNFVINAVPFDNYVSTNPSDYANQIYGGFSAAYVPQYGFQQIVFNLNVTQFA